VNSFSIHCFANPLSLTRHKCTVHAHKRNSSKCSPLCPPPRIRRRGCPFVLYNKLTNGRNSLLGLPWQSAAGGQNESGEEAAIKRLLTNAELMVRQSENGVWTNHKLLFLNNIMNCKFFVCCVLCSLQTAFCCDYKRGSRLEIFF